VPVSASEQGWILRYLQGTWPAEEEINLQSAVQNVVLEHRWRYGYRRVTAELRLRGMIVNRKRVARIMREDNLLAVRRAPPSSAQRSIRTVRIYLNLPSRMKIFGPNQLWISDITYVRLYREFVYLAVVLDVFSRKVVGWSLGRTLQAKLPLRALDKAIATRRPPPGVVHHSDQGVQYTCRDYMQKLREHRMLPSISRPANPFDNATCESFLKTIKREEIHATVYCDFEDLHNRVLEFIEQYYNRCRLHSALGYRSPERFEKETAESTSEAVCAAALMTFCGT
jgi:putative transposase